MMSNDKSRLRVFCEVIEVKKNQTKVLACNQKRTGTSIRLIFNPTENWSCGLFIAMIIAITVCGCQNTHSTATVGWQPYGSRYAIIVMSDGSNSDKYFWPVTKSMYSYLLTMGFDKEDIRFLAPSKYATNYPDIVSDEAVETKIEEAYKWAKSVCTAQDLLYIFWISHGTSSDFTTAGNSVRHSTLSDWMHGITAKQIIGVYQPCLSGAVVDDISGENIITTTSTNLTATNDWPWAENIAFAVAGPPYCDQWMNPNHELEPAKYSADHDGDGQVSMTEAYIWVAKHRYTEGSMFDDNGDGLGGQWTKDTFDPNDPNKDGYNGSHYSLRGWKPIRKAAVKSDSGRS